MYMYMIAITFVHVYFLVVENYEDKILIWLEDDVIDTCDGTLFWRQIVVDLHSYRFRK